MLRPFPQFDGVTAVNSTWANSIYHALEVKVEKRYSKGLTITGSYTRSKLIDYDIGAFAGETLGGGAIQDWNNLRVEPVGIDGSISRTASSRTRFTSCRSARSCTESPGK